jgi:hypothetical protein
MSLCEATENSLLSSPSEEDQGNMLCTEPGGEEFANK